LFDALYAKGQLRLDYDNSRTRNAAEAFEARSGNCMSLLIMTGAFAQSLGLKVHYQTVLTDEAWAKSDNLYFAIGHVNIRLGQPRPGWEGSWMTIDFLPGQNLARQQVRQIDEARVLAMFMNNRSAEALSRGDLDEAYAWVRAASRADPQFAAVYNTLGVVYLHHGALAEAEKALRAAHGLEPDNPHALGNLVQVLFRQGRDAEAQGLRAALERLQSTPPFALFEQGRQAMRDGNFRHARQLFEAEIARSPDYHEFHFWLALAHLQLGETRAAERELQAALASSSTAAQHAIYAGKLEKLKAAVH
jgi:Flp pilus assembly protein TadD